MATWANERWGVMAILTVLILAAFSGIAAGQAQENQLLVADDHEEHESEAREFGEVMGIVTFVLLASTVALGVFRKKGDAAKMLRIHKACGVATLIAAAVHATLIILT